MTISAALFDLDGTLVDSLDDLTDAVNHMLTDFGRQQLEPRQVKQLVGKGARNLVQRALDTSSTEEIDYGLSVFINFNTLHIADKSRLYNGALELLQQLASSGIRMAVISNKQELLSRLILKALNVDAFFDFIAGGDTFPEMKPSPLPLIKIIGKFGLGLTDTVMIGDSINDIQAGKRAGIITIGCLWGYGDTQELSDAVFKATTCDEIYNIIRTLE